MIMMCCKMITVIIIMTDEKRRRKIIGKYDRSCGIGTVYYSYGVVTVYNGPERPADWKFWLLFYPGEKNEICKYV